MPGLTVLGYGTRAVVPTARRTRLEAEGVAALGLQTPEAAHAQRISAVYRGDVRVTTAEGRVCREHCLSE